VELGKGTSGISWMVEFHEKDPSRGGRSCMRCGCLSTVEDLLKEDDENPGDL